MAQVCMLPMTDIHVVIAGCSQDEMYTIVAVLQQLALLGRSGVGWGNDRDQRVLLKLTSVDFKSWQQYRQCPLHFVRHSKCWSILLLRRRVPMFTFISNSD